MMWSLGSKKAEIMPVLDIYIYMCIYILSRYMVSTGINIIYILQCKVYIQHVCVCAWVCICVNTPCKYRQRSGKVVVHTSLWLCLVVSSLQSFPVQLIWSDPQREEEQGNQTHFTKEGAGKQGGEGHGSRPRWNWVPEQDSGLGFLMPGRVLWRWLCDNFPILGRVKTAFQSFSMCTHSQSLVCFAARLFIYWAQHPICHAYWGN